MDRRDGLTVVDGSGGPPSPVPVDVTSLLPGDSPRLLGEDLTHAHMLAGVDAALPPILVHRPSGTVIDGMHRLRAAILRGDEFIEVVYHDGDQSSAFVEAVESNTTHGLPLTRADREAAVEKIIRFFPQWSDRSVARITGLSAKKVRSIRALAVPEDGGHGTRIGRDGRVRPIDGSAGRRRAAEVLAERPDAPISDVARTCGIAIGTARDVRDRIRRGESPLVRGRVDVSEPVPTGTRADDGGEDGPGVAAPAPVAEVAPPSAAKDLDHSEGLEVLKHDPSLRFTVAGRTILQLIGATRSMSMHLDGVVDHLPPHCSNAIAELAHRCAATWSSFAEKLENREELRHDA